MVSQYSTSENRPDNLGLRNCETTTLGVGNVQKGIKIEGSAIVGAWLRVRGHGASDMAALARRVV